MTDPNGMVKFYVWKESLFSFSGERDTDVRFYGRTLSEYAELRYGAVTVETFPVFREGETQVVLRSSHTCLPASGLNAMIQKARRQKKNLYFGAGWIIVEESELAKAKYFPLLGGAAFLSAEDYPYVADKIRLSIVKKLLKRGVIVENADTVYVDDTAIIESGVFLSHDVTVKGRSILKSGAKVLPYTVVEDGEVESFAEVGPFARLRKGSVIKSFAKVGNFTEIKNSTLGEGSKASHLTYVGDADIGKKCNLGCGTVFVNYDGKKKHRSVVGDKCFIGSNANVIAPVSLGENSFVAAGSTLTKDLEDGDFCIARERERIIKGRAKRYYNP